MRLRYVGDGSWIPGVPARDLSEEEARRHGAAIRRHEEATGRALYVAPADETSGPTERPAAQAREAATPGPSERPAAQARDLTTIRGIGRKLVQDLAALGVRSLGELAAADPQALADGLEAASLRQVEKWQEQARRLLEGSE